MDKIAFLFYGHLRSFKDTFYNFKKNILDTNPNIQIDIFIHTWDLLEHIEVRKQYEKDLSVAGKKVTEADINFIISNWKPVSYKIDQQLDFNETEKLEIEKLGFRPEHYHVIFNISYAIQELVKLKNANNEKYDFVVLTRMDINFLKPFDLGKLYQRNTSIHPQLLFTPQELENTVHYPFMETPDLIRNQNSYITGIDLLLVTSEKVIEYFGNWHEKVLTQTPKGIEGAFTRIIVENGFDYQLLYYTKPTSWTILRTNQISKVITDESQSKQRKEDFIIMKDFLIDNNITNNAVMYWDFERATSLKLQTTLVDIYRIPDYCRFLADTGKLDTLNNFLTELFSKEGILLREISALPDYKTVSHLNKIKEKYNRKQLGLEDLFANLYKLGMSNQVSELISILKIEWKKSILPDISAEENMILNFAFNKIIEHYKLDANLAASLIDHLFVVKHMNDTRKAYLLNKILSYFNEIEIEARNFFILKDQYYNHLQKFMSMIHKFSREMIGAKLALDNLYVLIRKYNDLSLANSENQSPKVAICISGMCRNDLGGLESIYKHLTTPLKADVFIHTWDVQQEWIGGSRANDRFWFRTFNVNESSVPTKLKNLEFLKAQYPNIYDSLMTVSFTKLDGKNLENKFDFKRFTIENQEGFLSAYSIDENYKSRGSLNQIKMFYGMWKAFDTLKEYEEQNNFKYDYIIRVRPDLIIKSGVSVESLSLLSHDEIGVPTSFYGIQDMVFYAPRFSYEQAIGIFNPMLENKKLSPFLNFPKYDAHALFFAWLLKYNIKPAPCDIKYNIEEGVRNLKVPNLKGALDHDLNDNNKLKYPEETKWLENLLTKKAQ